MEALREAVDGSSVIIRAPDAQPTSRPTSIGVFAVKGRWQEFTTSDRAAGRSIATALGIELTQTYTYQLGTLSLGTRSFYFPGPDGGQTDLVHFGVWEGELFSIHTHLYDGTAQDLIPIFDEFRIVEGARGVHLVPRDSRQTRLAREPSFLQEFSHLGLLNVRPLTRSLARNLPKWQGTRAAGGELFVGRRPDSVHLLLIGKRSHTMIMPDGGSCDDDDLSQIMRLEVAWHPGTLVATNM